MKALRLVSWGYGRYKKYSTSKRQSGSGQKTIVTPGVEATIESQTEEDDERRHLNCKKCFLLKVACFPSG